MNEVQTRRGRFGNVWGAWRAGIANGADGAGDRRCLSATRENCVSLNCRNTWDVELGAQWLHWVHKHALESAPSVRASDTSRITVTSGPAFHDGAADDLAHVSRAPTPIATQSVAEWVLAGCVRNARAGRRAAG